MSDNFQQSKEKKRVEEFHNSNKLEGSQNGNSYGKGSKSYDHQRPKRRKEQLLNQLRCGHPDTHQESVNSITQDYLDRNNDDGRDIIRDQKQQSLNCGLVEDAKMKKYLIKIFEKMQESGSGGGSLIMQNTTEASVGAESPDPLMEHSNSVQEPKQSTFKQKDNQSSLSDITKHFAESKSILGSGTRNNATMARKIQFYTSNNFYPSGQQQSFNGSQGAVKLPRPLIESKQAQMQKAYEHQRRVHNNKYQDSENYIEEESSDDDNRIVTDDERDYKRRMSSRNAKPDECESENVDDDYGAVVQEQTLKNPIVGTLQQQKLSEVGSHKIARQQLQQSPGGNQFAPTNYGQTGNMQQSFADNRDQDNKFQQFNQQSRNQLNNKLMKIKSTHEDTNQSYNDVGGGDRSVSNRTPLLEHYQGSRNVVAQHYNTTTQGNANYLINQSTSVPRPTIASELKQLKDSRGSPPGCFDMISSYQSSSAQNHSNQFVQGNSLANFIWNKQGQTEEDLKRAALQSREGGARVRKDFNIQDGVTSVRPLTRSNQRRPVSRQVNAVDNSGMSVSKLLVQQQMRNTHFGEGGFGGFHQSKFKGTTAALIVSATSGSAFDQMNLESDRVKVSRKRGAKLTAGRTNGNTGKGQEDQHNSIRDSYSKIATLQGSGNTAVLTQGVGIQPLNRSITFNQQSQPIEQQQLLSTQESSGNHFYQPASSFLNKSIESNSS